MKIGEILKKYRLNLGLTLSEMSADIVSTSYYSKVEKGQHRISAEDLFDILSVHSISLGTFINELTEEGDKPSIIQQKILSFYYDRDAEAIRSTLKKLDDKDSEDEQMTIALATSCLYDLDDTFTISDNSIDMIKEKIFTLPNWNYFKLSLYTNFISFYDIETNHLIIRSILSKEMFKYKENEQLAIVAILLNFVDDLIEEEELTYASCYLQKVEDILTPLPELLFYHVIMNVHKNILNYLTSNNFIYIKKCEETIDFFKANGYETYAVSLREYLDEKISN